VILAIAALVWVNIAKFVGSTKMDLRSKIVGNVLPVGT